MPQQITIKLAASSLKIILLSKIHKAFNIKTKSPDFSGLFVI
jgi:hypothetical protein